MVRGRTMARRAFAGICCALLGPLLLTASFRSAAQPAAITAAPSTSVTVDESSPPPPGKPDKTLAGWSSLWEELPKASADLRIALAEIERAEAATRISYGAVLPTINASATWSYSSVRQFVAGQLASGGILQAQLSASQVLVNLRSFHQIGTQKALEEVVRLDALEVRRRLGLGLARAAASIAAARRLTEGNRTSLQLSLDRLLLTKKRLAAGVGDARDLVRAQQDVATARAVIAPADESLLQAQEGLATLIGATGSIGLAVDLEGLDQQLRSFCGEPGATDKERLDVTIAKKRIAIAERNVEDITLKFVPTLTAQASAGLTGPAFGGPFANVEQISVVLSIPLFDGGVRYGEKRDRVALVEEARARALQVQVAAMVERAQARRALDVALAAQRSAKEARDLAAEADRLAQAAYAGGVGTNFDLIDAGRRLRESETQLVLRDLDVAKARLALPFVEGTCAGVATKGKS